MSENIAAQAEETRTALVGNDDIKEAGNLELSPGETVSPDQFEVLGNIHDTTKATKKAAKKDPQTEDVISAPDEKEEVQKAAPKTEEAKKEEVSRETDKAQTDDKSVKSETKILKAKLGDQAVDLTPDHLIEINVDGKPMPVKIADLVKDFNGKTVWPKKFEQLGQIKTQLNQERAQVKAIMEDVMAGVETQDIDMVLRTAAKIAGYDDKTANDVIQKYYQAAIDRIESYKTMTPAERELELLKTKEKHREYSENKQKLREESASKEKALQEHIAQIMVRSQIDQETFVQRFDELTQFKKAGQLTQNITPELVESYHLDCIRYDKANNILESLPAEYIPSDKIKNIVLDGLRDSQAEMPNLTDQELKEIALEVLGKKVTTPKTLTEQEKKALQKKVTGSKVEADKKSPVKKPTQRVALTMDDLDVL